MTLPKDVEREIIVKADNIICEILDREEYKGLSFKEKRFRYLLMMIPSVEMTKLIVDVVWKRPKTIKKVKL